MPNLTLLRGKETLRKDCWIESALFVRTCNKRRGKRAHSERLVEGRPEGEEARPREEEALRRRHGDDDSGVAGEHWIQHLQWKVAPHDGNSRPDHLSDLRGGDVEVSPRFILEVSGLLPSSISNKPFLSGRLRSGMA